VPLSPDFEDLLDTAKKAAAILRDGELPYLLAGGLAAWARGGPPTEHDVDVFVRPEDAERALHLFEEAGMKTEKPPEEWLYKAYDNGKMIDVIFRPTSGEVDEEMFERGDELEVAAVRMPVMAAEDILVTKLLALREHHLVYDSVFELARALREQIDWESVRTRTKESPFAQAFFVMAEGLGVIGS
jgi:hypothetical protein